MNGFKSLFAVVIVFVCTAVFSSIIVQAEGVPVRGPIPFAAYDQDGNGVISEDEFNRVRSERMSQRMGQGQGMMGQGQGMGGQGMMGQGQGMGQGMMGQGQGMMGQGQGMGMRRNMPAFSDYDLDGNGRIMEKEFNEARAKRIGERARQGYPMRNIGNAPSFADIDTNGDGVISPNEFAAHQSRRRQ